MARKGSSSRGPQHPAVTIARPPLRPLALFTLFAALALVGLGGVVHSTGSSLACPDWPLCRGEVMPRMEGGVLYEHSHRLLALVVLAGVLLLPWAASGARKSTRLLAWLGAALVIVQALLGALTVLLRLPPLVSISHLACATALVALLTWIASADGLGQRAPRPPGVSLALGVVVVQVVLGAAVRHLGASTACGRDLIGCAGEGLPLTGAAWLHFVHRGVGLVALALVARAAILSMRDPSARRLGALLGIGAAAQVALGFTSVALGPHVAIVTAHLVLGELLVAGLVLRLARAALQRPDGRSRVPPPALPSSGRWSTTF